MNAANRLGQWPGWMITRVKYILGRNFKELGLELDRRGSVMSNDIAFMQQLNRHRQIMGLAEEIP